MNENILHNQARLAAEILSTFQHPQPFHLHLKEKFRLLKKAGSRDRKTIRSMCYAWFRLGRTLEDELAAQVMNGFVILKEWYTLESRDIPTLYDLIHQKYPGWSSDRINPFTSELSAEIQSDEVDLMYLTQPLVWVWSSSKNAYTFPDAFVWNEYPWAQGLPAGISLDFNNQPIQVQDLSSQIMCRSLPFEGNEKLWDACAASGGKSLHIKKLFPGIRLLMTDKRQSMLEQLKLRFKKAGIQGFKWAVVDLSTPTSIINVSGFNNETESLLPESMDFILLDVPCTGSGTWGRNPENISSFQKESIRNYMDLQEDIIKNTWPYLKKNGLLCYSTCSVFKNENEDHQQLFASLNAQLLEKRYEGGYKWQSDILFWSLWRKI